MWYSNNNKLLQFLEIFILLIEKRSLLRNAQNVRILVFFRCLRILQFWNANACFLKTRADSTSSQSREKNNLLLRIKQRNHWRPTQKSSSWRLFQYCKFTVSDRWAKNTESKKLPNMQHVYNQHARHGGPHKRRQAADMSGKSWESCSVITSKNSTADHTL